MALVHVGVEVAHTSAADQPVTDSSGHQHRSLAEFSTRAPGAGLVVTGTSIGR